MTQRPRIAIPEPTSSDPSYNQRSWPQYAHAIDSCGGIAVPVPLTESQATVAHLISTCAAVLLPGSPADVNPQKYNQSPTPKCSAPDPGRESVDELLLQDAFNLHKPILGICYGIQALNVWRNGTLIQHLQTPVNHEPGRDVQHAHALALLADSRLAGVLSEARDLERNSNEPRLQVNSSHHQAVDVPGDGLDVAARAADDGVIEALELRAPDHWVVGVQWHPERTFGFSSASRALFLAFVAAATEWKLHPIQESVVGSTTGR